jgi:hypothetical protein
MRESGGNIGQAGAETVNQPRESVQLAHAVNVVGVPVERQR